MSARKAIPKRLRYEVLVRDDHTCRYCGAKAPDAKLEVDHVIPVALGGATEPSNLITACDDCNNGKGSSSAQDPIVDDVAADALRWSDAIRHAADELRAARSSVDASVARWHAAWAAWTYPGADGEPKQIPLPASWEESIRALLEAGADLDTLIEFVAVTMRSRAKDEFRYFCGCGWNHVRALQARAKQILAGDEDTPPEHPAYSYDDDVREAYWAGHIAGFNEGYQDGWEVGLAAGHAREADRPRHDDPTPLEEILNPLKERASAAHPVRQA